MRIFLLTTVLFVSAWHERQAILGTFATTGCRFRRAEGERTTMRTISSRCPIKLIVSGRRWQKLQLSLLCLLFCQALYSFPWHKPQNGGCDERANILFAITITMPITANTIVLFFKLIVAITLICLITFPIFWIAYVQIESL